MSIEMGDLLLAMNTDLRKEVEERAQSVHKSEGWNDFWLVYSEKPDKFLMHKKVSRAGWSAIEMEPLPQSNTIMFHVNWKSGKIDRFDYPPSNDEKFTDIYGYKPVSGEKFLDYTRKI
jgi:hypothetical protein